MTTPKSTTVARGILTRVNSGDKAAMLLTAVQGDICVLVVDADDGSKDWARSLFTAVPEMLEVLELVYKEWCPRDAVDDEVLEKVDAVIAKAKGQA